MYNIQVEDVILNKIKPSSIKFNKNKIKEFENRIGVTFPKEYIKFLEKYNGGFPEENLVISKEAPPFILTSLLANIYSSLPTEGSKSAPVQKGTCYHVPGRRCNQCTNYL
jgi:hypothetical protein